MLTKSGHTGLLICILMISGAVVASAQVGTISGTITPNNSGATVTARNTLGSDYQEVTADPSTGYYLVSGLSDGEYEVIASAPGFVVEMANVTIAYGAPVTQDFTLQAAGSISGSVTPIDAIVRVQAAEVTTGEAYDVHTDTTDGAFVISQIRPGTYQLCVLPKSIYLAPPCEEDVVVTANQVSSGHNFALSLGGIIAGSVTPIPANGMVIAVPTDNTYIEDCTAAAGIDPVTGQYSVVGLTGGTYNLAFYANGYIRDVGSYTGVSNSTLTPQEITDVTGVVNSWVQAHEALNASGVLSFLDESYIEVGSDLGKADIASIAYDEFAALQSLSIDHSVDVVKGISGISAAVVFQANRTYTPISGPVSSRRLEGLLTFTKVSSSWLISSGKAWHFGRLYDPLEGETTPVVVEYQQDPAISNISVTAGQVTQVPTWTLRPAQ